MLRGVSFDSPVGCVLRARMTSSQSPCRAKSNAQERLRPARPGAKHARAQRKPDRLSRRSIRSPPSWSRRGSRSIVREMRTIIIRTAYSRMIIEGHDFSSAVLTPQGDLVAASELEQPTHISALSWSARASDRQVRRRHRARRPVPAQRSVHRRLAPERRRPLLSGVPRRAAARHRRRHGALAGHRRHGAGQPFREAPRTSTRKASAFPRCASPGAACGSPRCWSCCSRTCGSPTIAAAI